MHRVVVLLRVRRRIGNTSALLCAYTHFYYKTDSYAQVRNYITKLTRLTQ